MLVGGQVEVDRGDGNVAVAHGVDVDVVAVIVDFKRAVEPVIGASARIEPLVEFLDKTRAAHPGDFDPLELVVRQIGHVDVEKHVGRH